MRLLCAAAALLSASALRAQTLAVIVNPVNTLPTLSAPQVLNMFVGRFHTFPNGLAVHPIDLGINSPERTLFYRTLGHKEPSEMAAYWARVTFSGLVTAPFQVVDARAAVDLVARDPSAIAYVFRDDVDTRRVRVVLEVRP